MENSEGFKLFYSVKFSTHDIIFDFSDCSYSIAKFEGQRVLHDPFSYSNFLDSSELLSSFVIPSCRLINTDIAFIATKIFLNT